MIKSETTTRNSESETPSLEVLMASIYYLMTRHAIRPDPNIASAIADHLDMLANHKDCDSLIWRRAGERLSSQWQNCVSIAANVKYCKFHMDQSSLSGRGKLH